MVPRGNDFWLIGGFDVQQVEVCTEGEPGEILNCQQRDISHNFYFDWPELFSVPRNFCQ